MANQVDQKAQQQKDNIAGSSIMEPSYVAEFKEISSQYIVANKEDSEEISSNGEFEQADAMAVYNEDATEVFRIEEEKKWQVATGMKHISPPNTLM